MATKYFVFASPPEPLAEVEAASATAAIRACVGGGKIAENGDGKFVAVPARSWSPVTVKVERTVKIG